MNRSREKRERALGVKLFLKGERCSSPKCAMMRRPHRPGEHGKSRRRPPSEYGLQLLEKQRVRVSYGLREAQLQKIFKEALKKIGSVGEAFTSLLERQLYNVVYRLGFAPSRVTAMQLVGHGHFFVNNKKVRTSSYLVRVGDRISINPSSREILIFKGLQDTIRKHEAPDWLLVDKEKIGGEMKSLPHSIEMPFDIGLVVDYYSK